MATPHTHTHTVGVSTPQQRDVSVVVCIALTSETFAPAVSSLRLLKAFCTLLLQSWPAFNSSSNCSSSAHSAGSISARLREEARDTSASTSSNEIMCARLQHSTAQQ